MPPYCNHNKRLFILISNPTRNKSCDWSPFVAGTQAGACLSFEMKGFISLKQNALFRENLFDAKAKVQEVYLLQHIFSQCLDSVLALLLLTNLWFSVCVLKKALELGINCCQHKILNLNFLGYFSSFLCLMGNRPTEISDRAALFLICKANNHSTI